MLSVCPPPSSSPSSTSSPRVATSAQRPSCYLCVHHPHHPLRSPHHPALPHQHGGLPAMCVSILLLLLTNLPQHPELPHQHGQVHGGLLALCVHPPLPPSSSSSPSSSSPSSQTYLNTPSCPISTTWCTAAFLLCVCPSSSSLSPAYLNTPSCPIRRARCTTAFLALCVHPPPLPYHHHRHLKTTSTPRVAPSEGPGARQPSLLSVCIHPPPPHHHHQPISTPRFAPSERQKGLVHDSLPCSLCPSSSSSSPSSQTYLNTPSCPISTAWCTAAFLLSMCPFSLHHMRCGG